MYAKYYVLNTVGGNIKQFSACNLNSAGDVLFSTEKFTYGVISAADGSVLQAVGMKNGVTQTIITGPDRGFDIF